MITNKDLSIDSKNGQVILNGDKYDLGTQGEIDAAVKDIYSVMGQNGAKNLIPYPYYEKTHTENGVNFTDNGDGSITVDTDGSASTGNANFYCQAPTVISNLIKLDKNKTYIFSDTTHSGIVNNCVVGIRYFAEGVVPSTATGTAKSCNASINWQVTVTNAVYAFVYVYVWSGKTISNITFKPMLRLASDTDDTYQPYAKTNRQLTEVIGDLSGTGVTGADVATQISTLNTDLGNKIKLITPETVYYTSTSTNLEYTGVSVECPTGHEYIVRAKCNWDNANTQSIAVSDSSSDVSTQRRFAYSDSAYVTFMLGAGETAYIWGKWASASRNAVILTITDITL